MIGRYIIKVTFVFFILLINMTILILQSYLLDYYRKTDYRKKRVFPSDLIVQCLLV